MVKRISILGVAAVAMTCAGLGSTGLGAGVAQADDNGWGPPKHWCPGEPAPVTGNHVTDPLNWDWNICHTYYILYPGMGNVSHMFWDGDNPPPKPPPPTGLYCDMPSFTNCRIGNHP
jgi:hypothetical protein